RKARRTRCRAHRALAGPWRADERQGRRPVQGEQGRRRGLTMKALSAQETASSKRVLLSRIHGAFGVRGELKLESFTDPARGIFRYQPWVLRAARGTERELEGARGRETAKGIVATIPGIEDRDAADAMRGTEVWVARSA